MGSTFSFALPVVAADGSAVRIPSTYRMKTKRLKTACVGAIVRYENESRSRSSLYVRERSGDLCGF